MAFVKLIAFDYAATIASQFDAFDNTGASIPYQLVSPGMNGAQGMYTGPSSATYAYFVFPSSTDVTCGQLISVDSIGGPGYNYTPLLADVPGVTKAAIRYSNNIADPQVFELWDVVHGVIGTIAFGQDTEYYLELHVKIDAVVGVVEGRVNGVVFASFTGDTTGLGAVIAQMAPAQMEGGGGNAGPLYVDSIYVIDNTTGGDVGYYGNPFQVDGVGQASTYASGTAFVGVAPIDPATSIISVSNPILLVGDAAIVTLTGYDFKGEAITIGGATVTFAIDPTGPGYSAGTLSAVTDNGNGTYTAIFTATTVGAAVEVTGTINGEAVTTTLPLLIVLTAPRPSTRRLRGMGSRLQRSDFSRMWLIDGKAGPGNAPQYESYWKAGAVSWPLGDATNVYVPDPGSYGLFDVVGKIIGEPGNPTIPVTAKYLADARSVLLRLAELGCDVDLHIHMGFCKDPRDFNAGWDKIMVLEAARPTTYGTTDLGALMPSERATVNEEVPFSGERLYEIMPIAMEEQAAGEIVQEVIAIVVCDSANCGDCGIPSDGCQVVFALTLTAGGSPGLPAEVLYTSDGGATWGDTNITTLAANQDPNALACIAGNLVVISEDSESIHYADLAEILAGTETWAEVSTGFVATKGPLALFTSDPAHTWIVGEGGYIYFTDDPTSGVSVQDAGVVSAQNLLSIHGIDALHLVAVGASNAVVVTANGGETWAAVTGPAVGVTLNTVWMRSEREWLVGTATGLLYYTLDSGETWTLKGFPGSGAGVIRDIKFSSANVGWMAHDTATPAGRILRTINGGYSWYVAPEGNLSIPTNDRIDALAVCENDVNVIYGAGLAGNAVDGIIVKGA